MALGLADVLTLRSVCELADARTYARGEAGDHADRLAGLARLLDKRVVDGDPKLVEIIEEAIELAQEAIRHIDDSNGLVMGIAAFGKERIDDLVEFCIHEHRRRGNADLVESLAWQRFVQQPGSDAYFRVVGVAKRIARDEVLAAKALEHLSELVRAEGSPSAFPAGSRRSEVRWLPYIFASRIR